MFDQQTQSTALSLIAQYGADAEIIAVMRAAELAAAGDADGLAAWDAIIACIAAITESYSGSRPIQ